MVHYSFPMPPNTFTLVTSIRALLLLMHLHLLPKHKALSNVNLTCAAVETISSVIFLYIIAICEPFFIALVIHTFVKECGVIFKYN